MAIYSSGSVFAQKLLMRHVKGEEGTENLEDLVSGGWFDTVNAGLKAEKGSYEKISGELKVRFLRFFFRSVCCEVGRGLFVLTLDVLAGA